MLDAYIKNSISRRTLVHGLLKAHGMTLFAPTLTTAQIIEKKSAKSDWHHQQLSDKVHLFVGPKSNVLAISNGLGLCLLDSGDSESTDSLLKALAVLREPIKAVINTHWHADHSGGNEIMHDLGAKIIAHENTRLWLGAEFKVAWREEHYSPRPTSALPDETFYGSGRLELFGTSFNFYHPEQAHTDGDLYIHLEEENIIHCGGLLTNNRWPICDIATGGWLGGLIKGNEEMLALSDENTRLIPDQGGVLGRADLEIQLSMLQDLYAKMKTMMIDGFHAQNMMDANLTRDYEIRLGDPSEFIRESYLGMALHTGDMGGFI
jgi:cyclase